MVMSKLKKSYGYHLTCELADRFDEDVSETVGKMGISKSIVLERLMMMWLDSPPEARRKIVNPLPEANTFVDYVNGIVDKRMREGALIAHRGIASAHNTGQSETGRPAQKKSKKKPR